MRESIVIADASVLIALTNVSHLEILPQLYGSVVITPEVESEYGLPLPEWMVVQRLEKEDTLSRFLQKLDLGEASAVALALEIGSNPLLAIDERRGRAVAKEINLRITGTLGIIVKAHQEGILSEAIQAVRDLERGGFRMSTSLKNQVIALLKST